jgi:hypothetical protein
MSSVCAEAIYSDLLASTPHWALKIAISITTADWDFLEFSGQFSNDFPIFLG